MIKEIKRIGAISILLSGVLTSCSTGVSGDYKIELYSQNDIHGRFFDSLYVGNAEHKSSLANVSGFINERRTTVGAENVILIDNGDHLQGDNAAYYFNFVEKPISEQDTTKHLFSRLMNYVGFDAVVVGNHDIETGHPIYDRITKELKMPYLAANAVKDNGSGESYFKPYTIINKNGVKVAIIGMTNPNIKSWLAPALWKGMDFLPIDKIADSLVNVVVEKEKPHVVVLAVHAGIGELGVENIENPVRNLASKLKNVDIIFAAHDHQRTVEKIFNGVDSVLVMDGGARAELLSGVDINLVLKNGKVVSKKIDGKLIKLSDTKKDEAFVNNFKGDFNKVKTFTNQNVGSVSREINTFDAFFGSSDYMDIIHFVQLNETGADISFAAPITYKSTVKKGDINFQDLFTIYPFENQLYTLPLTGKQVKAYLEFSYDNWINTMASPADHIMQIAFNEKSGKYKFKNFTFNFDSGAGLNYTVDITKPYGERVNISSLSNGKPFSEDATYKIAVSSYRANGGGDLFKAAGIQSSKLEGMIISRHPEIRDLLYSYFKEGKLSKLPEYKNWKFVPQNYTYIAIRRDRALL